MIKPIGNRIFLKKDEQPDRKGDIILLKKDGMYAPPYSGTIIGIGDEVEDKEYQKEVNAKQKELEAEQKKLEEAIASKDSGESDSSEE